MKKMSFLGLIFNITLCACNAQTFNFADTSFNVGDQLSRGQIYSPDCQINNKDFPFIDSLANFLIRNEQIAILIEFHTDIRGSVNSNQSQTEICGKRRLESYLNHSYPSINFSRIKYACLGEFQPVHNQNDIDKIKDNEEKEVAYAQNRRTIIKIIQTDLKQ